MKKKRNKSFALFIFVFLFGACSSSLKDIPTKQHAFEGSVPKDYLDQRGFGDNADDYKSPYLLGEVKDSEDRFPGKEVDDVNIPGKFVKTGPLDEKPLPDDPSEFIVENSNEKEVEKKDYGEKDKFSKSTIFGVDTKYNGKGEYLVHKNSDIIKEIYGKGKSSFGFSYILSSGYDVKSSDNTFNEIFAERDGVTKTGFLFLKIDNFISRGALDLTWGFNFGVSYNHGKALFADGSISPANFTVWFVPIDLKFGFGIPITRFVRLSGSAGPSAMMVYQTRDDKEDGEKYKRRRQVGVGYFASGKLSFSLSSMFDSIGFGMYRDYNANDLRLDFEARLHNYDNFQDDYTVEGMSVGAGFTFEFL